MAGDVGETNDRFFKFGEEKESKERKEKALKEIEMGNAAYNATVLSDLLGTISSYQSKATFVAYKQCSGNKMDKVNEILSLAYIDIFFIMKCFMLLLYYRFWLLI
ncbi:BnaCnng27860D [Brassica napus]|uniref:BnaCnng27860D protein n=1 Tax=Brassica napus TaxID=3708 RepID=A0A078IXP8_BRANA|nr:BnaCnng27860D [Brassica napus]